MFLTFLLLAYNFLGIRMVSAKSASSPLVLFNFTTESSINGWRESSDTVREPGMSKATITLQKTKLFQRAVMFTMLNPQPNGAGFAGMNYHFKWNLDCYKEISLYVRGQGQNSGYKIVLRHKDQNHEPFPTYEQTFTVPMNEFGTVTLSLDNFKPFYRGKQLNDTNVDPLDKSFISSFGIQMYGGVYLPTKQSGVSSLEIDWIRAN